LSGRAAVALVVDSLFLEREGDGWWLMLLMEARKDEITRIATCGRFVRVHSQGIAIGVFSGTVSGVNPFCALREFGRFFEWSFLVGNENYFWQKYHAFAEKLPQLEITRVLETLFVFSAALCSYFLLIFLSEHTYIHAYL